jgi:hypothetical protein
MTRIQQLADSTTAVTDTDLLETARDLGTGSYLSVKRTAGQIAAIVASGSFIQNGSSVIRTVVNKLREEVSLDDFKDAGMTDAEALQAAIDYCSQNDVGCVRIPARLVTIDESITVKEGVCLLGYGYGGSPEYDTNAWVYDEKGLGSTFRITFGAGETADALAAFIMERSSSIENCIFWYPDQEGSTATPDTYPPTIAMGVEDVADPDALSDIRIEKCTFVNPYVGVRAVKTHGRFVMRDVNMAFWLQGIVLDKSLDVDRLENIHINPGIMYRGEYPSNHNFYWQYQQATSYAIHVGACDQPYLHSVFTFGGRIGLRVAPLTTGYPNGVIINQSGFEGAYRCVQIENIAQTTKFTGCIFGTFDLNPGGGLYGDSAIVIAGDGGANLIRWTELVNCLVFGARKCGIEAANFKNIKVIGCTFNGLHAVDEGFGAPAMSFASGNGMIFLGNSLAMNGGSNAGDYYLKVHSVGGGIIKDNLWANQPGSSARFSFTNSASCRADCNMASDTSGGVVYVPTVGGDANADVIVETPIPYTA